MRFIVNKKLYDTDKAELICTGLKKWDINAVVYARLSTSLYRTSKGTFYRRSGKYVSAAREEYR